MDLSNEKQIRYKNLYNYFVNMITTQFAIKIKMIRTDNGMKFNMPSYYSSLGIIHQKSYVETPQQNSTVERKHRHLLNVTRALLFHYNLPKCFRSFLVCHAAFLINRYLALLSIIKPHLNYCMMHLLLSLT